jgi:hypothetical protein
LPTSFDYESANYSSSTLDGLFPTTTVTGFGSVDSWIMNDPTLFGDSDYVGGFSVNAFGPWSLRPSNFGPSEDRPRKGGSCASDGTSSAVHRCETEEDLSSLIATSPGAGSDGGMQPAQQSSNLPSSNLPVGGNNPSARFEITAAQNSFAMTWPSGAIQGTFPLACDACDVTPPVVLACDACDVTPPVVNDAFAPASDFVNLTGPTTAPLFGATLGDLSVTPATSIPEIPPTAMLLIGFAGLALVGRRPLWRSARLG